MSVALPNPVRLDPWQLIRDIHFGGVPELFWVTTQPFGPADPTNDYTTTVTIPTDVSSADNICQSQTPTGAFALNGSAVSGGSVTLSPASRVTITTTGDESGKTITVMGTLDDGTAGEVKLNGPVLPGGQHTPVGFRKVTGLTITDSATGLSVTAAGAITVGAGDQSQSGDELIIALANYGGGGAIPPGITNDTPGNHYDLCRDNLAGLAILSSGNCAPIKGGDTITMTFAPGGGLSGPGGASNTGVILLARGVNVSSFRQAANGAFAWEVMSTRRNDVILGAAQIIPVGSYPGGTTLNLAAPDLVDTAGYANLRQAGTDPHDFYGETGIGLFWRLSGDGTEAVSFQPTSVHDDPSQGTQVPSLAALFRHK